MKSIHNLKKANDSIHRQSLLKILRHLGLHPKLVNMIALALKTPHLSKQSLGQKNQNLHS